MKTALNRVALRARLALLFAVACLAPALSPAQFGSFSDVPVEVDSDDTRFVGGTAVAERNVVIRYGDTTIYCDYAQYNTDTRDVFVRGNVRIFREARVFVGERAVYNLETKLLRTADFRSDAHPFLFSAETLHTVGGKELKVRGGEFTTNDDAEPHYRLRAKGVRIYPDDRVIFTGVSLYVGRTPILWWPYVYQSLNDELGLFLSPGYSSRWGAYLLTSYRFPISENLNGEFRFDLRSERGLGVGIGTDYEKGTGLTRSWGQFRAYYADDANPDKNTSSVPRDTEETGRYRIAFQHRAYISEDLYASIDINKLSDSEFLEDFEPGIFSLDPQPDNVVAVTKWDENWTLTGLARFQLNEFFDTTERLPELVLDIKRNPIFGGALFYEGETGIANLKRAFDEEKLLPEYDAIRFDTFHQISYPRTYGGWLAVIPKLGVRGTWYSDSGYLQTRQIIEPAGNGTGGNATVREVTELFEEGSLFRGAISGGVEASFKFSKAFEQVQSRAWGLDGLRHVVQPYTELSFLYTSEDSSRIYQFDRLIPSTQATPISFPQFVTTDSLNDWAIVRLGVRNRLQTRRDNNTVNWFEMDTFFDIYLDNPNFAGSSTNGSLSNLYNRIRWEPLPWLTLSLDAQIPLDDGFTEVNTEFDFLVTRDLKIQIGHRYLEGNPFFRDSNLLTFGAYYRLNEHWAFSLRERYEFDDGILESQLYEIHRDLSSWVASLGLVLRDNGDGNDEYGVLLTFTLKDLPNVTLPLNLDPQGTGGRD